MAAFMLGQQARQLSTSVARPVAKLVKPPIQVYGVEGRYATALFSAASKQNKLDQVEQELGKVSTLIKDPKLSSVVMNPHVKRNLKQKTFGDALTKAKLSPMIINLVISKASYPVMAWQEGTESKKVILSLSGDKNTIQWSSTGQTMPALIRTAGQSLVVASWDMSYVLAENGRLTLTSDVISAYGKMMSAHRGEVICSVTTAQPLDTANLAELKVALNGFLQKGETIKLETKTDPSILGGMVVSIGDKYVDMSTKTKIQKLTKLIKES